MFEPDILKHGNCAVEAYNTLLGKESYGLSLTLSKKIANCLGGDSDLNFVSQEVGTRFDLDV